MLLSSLTENMWMKLFHPKIILFDYVAIYKREMLSKPFLHPPINHDSVDK